MHNILDAVSVDKAYAEDPDLRIKVDAASEQRARYIQNITELMPYLPELPEQAADEVYERIAHHERKISPNSLVSDYGDGGAMIDDEIWSDNVRRGVLLSADHATDPVRKATGVREGADHGTGGLVMALSENGHYSMVLPAGKQTGNVNVDLTSPAKSRIASMLPTHDSFISVHGMKPGKFEHQFDDREIHAVIGLGSSPTEADRAIADEVIVKALDEYGLRLVVGNDTRFFDTSANSPRLDYDDDGSPKYSARLAALGEGSTTNFVRSQTDGRLFPAMQIEISRTLRLLPQDMEYRRNREKVMSVYMGYLMVSNLVVVAGKYAQLGE